MSPADIEANLAALEERIAGACRRAGRARSDVTLIAVSKTVEAEAMLTAYHCGICHFGENRVQEGLRKWPLLASLNPPPVLHLIGHLQSNKIKPALEHFDILHSLDSAPLAEAINRRASSKFPVLLEVNVAREASKSGFSPEDVIAVFETVSALPNLGILGLMTVAPITADPEEARPVFRQLRQLCDRLNLKQLSMGMTGDFEIAIEEGATLIRVGRAIFGERN